MICIGYEFKEGEYCFEVSENKIFNLLKRIYSSEEKSPEEQFKEVLENVWTEEYIEELLKEYNCNTLFDFIEEYGDDVAYNIYETLSDDDLEIIKDELEDVAYRRFLRESF